MTISKRRFEEVLPVSLMSCTLLVCIFGFLGNLLLGFYLSIIIAIAFPVIIIISLLKHKNLSNLSSDFLTPGFCIFLVIYTFIYILNFRRGFTQWDEISHWGPMVKETLRLNKFYCVPESTLSVHKDYPPIVSLFEYIWCKLSGGYQEIYLYRSLQLLSFSLFFPVFSKFKWKKNPKLFVKLILTVFLIISATIIIALGEARFYQTIYIDCFFGLLLAYCLAIVIIEKKITKFKVFNLSVALSFLLLTKQMGIAFFALTLAALLISYIIIYKNNPHQDLKKEYNFQKSRAIILILLAYIGIPLLFSFLWNSYTASYGISGQFKISSINISKLIEINNGTGGEAYQHETWTNFFQAFYTRELMTRPVPLSYWQLMIAAIVALLLVGKYGKKYFEKNQIEGLSIVLALGALGYSFALLLLYVFSFGSYEGPNLASFDRYMSTYLYAMFALVIMLFVFIEGQKEQHSENTSSATVGSIVIFIWLIILNPGAMMNFEPVLLNNSVTQVYNQDVDVIKNNTTQDDKVYIISQQSNGFVTFSIQYLIMPEKSNATGYSLGKPYNDEDIWTANMTKEELIDALISGEYGYLYLQKIDEQFIANYSDLFGKGTEIKDKYLYKIVKLGDNPLEFELVEY